MARPNTIEGRVLAWLNALDGDWITAQEAAQRIRPGMTWQQAKGALDRLRRRGLVQRLRAQMGYLPMYRLRPVGTDDCGGCRHVYRGEPDWECALGRRIAYSSFPRPMEPCAHYDDGSGGDSRDDA